MCGATTTPEPAAADAPAAVANTRIARKRRILRRGYGRACTADPDHGGVRQIGVKTVLRAELGGERLEEAHRHLEFRAARAADEVPMAVRVGQVPAGDAILEVRVRHEAEALERLEVAVDGRWVDLRMLPADPGRDVLGRGVMLRALERFEDQPALYGHPLAALADPVSDVHYRNSLATTCTLQSPA